MRHKVIPASDGYRRYSFAEVFRFSSGLNVCIISDPNHAYLALVVNYATASGTTTTTDSVSMTAPTITIGSTSLPATYSINLTDNSGDEGTGFYLSTFDIPYGTGSFVSNGQGAEDNYATYIFLFKDEGQGASSGSFAVYPPKPSASAPNDSNVPTNSVPNSNFSYWGYHAGGTAQLSTSFQDWTQSNFSDTLNIVLLFYHSFGSAAPLTPVWSMTDANDDPLTPVYSYSGGSSAFASEGQTAVSVYNGVYIGRQSVMRFTPATNASQGDQMIILQF